MLVTALIAAAVAAAPAAPSQPIVSKDGNAVYTRNVAPDGTVTLRGQDQVNGKMFRYTIYKNRRVAGWLGDERVRFLLP